jgi:hypothetical protein
MNPTVSVSLLVSVANRCLREHASRALDAKIYCAVLGVRDANELNSEFLIEARASGMVLIRATGLMGWLDAPHYTEDLNWAKSLLPEGLAAISNDPRVVCAIALMAIAMTDQPALLEARSS